MRTQPGFTLLELLVVLAIIGILTAMAVAAYRAYRNRAAEAAALQYMRAWIPAQEVYLQTYGHYADADEQLAEAGLGVNFVPTDIPYDFSIDSTSAEKSKWWGSATPARAGLRHFCITNTGVIGWSSSGPAFCP